MRRAVCALCFVSLVGLAALSLAAMSTAHAADIESTCYKQCEAQTSSNPEYKACLAQKADAADAVLNDAYKVLKQGIRGYAGEMDQNPKYQLQSLVEAQKKWIAFRDVTCRFEDELSFGRTSIGGNYSACLCVMSLQRVADFDRIGRKLLAE